MKAHIDPETGKFNYVVGSVIHSISHTPLNQLSIESSNLASGKLESICACRVIAESYANVNIKIYEGDNLVHSTQVVDEEPFWLPDSAPSYKWRFKLISSDTVYGVLLADTKDQLYG